jgi:hypothetical protein
MLRHASVKEAMGIASKDRCSTDVLQKDISMFLGDLRRVNRNIQNIR